MSSDTDKMTVLTEPVIETTSIASGGLARAVGTGSVSADTEGELLVHIEQAVAMLGKAELALQRARQLFYSEVVAASAADVPSRLIVQAAGISRQRLFQILAKAKASA